MAGDVISGYPDCEFGVRQCKGLADTLAVAVGYGTKGEIGAGQRPGLCEKSKPTRMKNSSKMLSSRSMSVHSGFSASASSRLALLPVVRI